ncbi:PD-(D/E)XK nuclease family protein, partial [bacterium]|nr:PD-(D/E)XK nuclease family protein [bacterium]
ICRLLAELLDPKGCHAQKTKYLDLFYEKFLHNKFKDLNTDKITVIKEDLTKQLEIEGKDKRRIDIVLNERNGHYIPIEVKINADEQPDQCEDYLKQADRCYKQRGINKDPFVCFLTKDGHSPTSIRESFLKEQIICISWIQISEWLDDCISISKNLNPINEILKQFKTVIDEYMEVSMNNTKEILNYTCVGNVTNEKEVHEIAERIKSDKEKLSSALKLYPAYLKATQDIWVDFANYLEEYIYNKYKKRPKNTDGKNWYLTYDLPNRYSIMIQSNARTELSSEDRLPDISVDLYKGNKLSDNYPDILPTLFDLIDDNKKEEYSKQIGDWLAEKYGLLK